VPVTTTAVAFVADTVSTALDPAPIELTLEAIETVASRARNSVIDEQPQIPIANTQATNTRSTRSYLDRFRKLFRMKDIFRDLFIQAACWNRKKTSQPILQAVSPPDHRSSLLF